MRMDQLPDDVETLKRLVIEHATALRSERLLVGTLRLQIARLRRVQFGRSSERRDEQIAQFKLIVEELEAKLPVQDDAPAPMPSAGANKPARKPLPERDAVTLLASLESWMRATLATVSATSEMASAFNYSLKRWAALTRYSQDGSIEIDNDAAERAMKGPVLGRKNWLFAGSHDGGERAAAMYSLLETAKLNGVDPQAYLRLVLQRISELPINRVEELLPWNISSERLQHEERLAA